MAAPPSCRAATNRAPAATRALVTWKLPLPTTPKTWSTPCARPASGRRPRRPARRPQRSTSASTRVGLPEPPTIGSGAAITTAPVGGSSARFCSWVRPYLPAPSRNEWHGNGGSNECAAPASVPTVSTPTPMTGASSASQRAHSTETPGVCGPVSSALRNAPGRATAASHPVRSSSQPPAGSGAVLCLPGPDVVDLEQEVGVGGHPRRASRARRRARPAGWPAPATTSSLSCAGDPVDRRVEVGAGVLAGAEVVPVPRRAAVVVAADLLAARSRPSARTARAARGSACRRTAAR